MSLMNAKISNNKKNRNERICSPLIYSNIDLNSLYPKEFSLMDNENDITEGILTKLFYLSRRGFGGRPTSYFHYLFQSGILKLNENDAKIVNSCLNLVSIFKKECDISYVKICHSLIDKDDFNLLSIYIMKHIFDKRYNLFDSVLFKFNTELYKLFYIDEYTYFLTNDLILVKYHLNFNDLKEVKEYDIKSMPRFNSKRWSKLVS